MFLKCLVLVCAVAACSAKKAAPPAPTPAPLKPPAPQVYCGEPPNNLLKCIGNVEVFDKDASKSCSGRHLSECDGLKCVFRASGWALAGDKVNKANMTAYFTQYATAHPEWAAAVQNLKQTCLGATDLPAQGALLDCAPYDVLHCILTSFIRNAGPGQWQGSAACAYPRSYAQACAHCPSACFAAAIPTGSCNACYAVPRAP